MAQRIENGKESFVLTAADWKMLQVRQASSGVQRNTNNCGVCMANNIYATRLLPTVTDTKGNNKPNIESNKEVSIYNVLRL